MTAPIIVCDPEILGGIPCFRGTRVPFQNLLDYLEAGDSLDKFLEQFPTVTREMAIEALETAADFAAHRAAHQQKAAANLEKAHG